MGRPELSFDNLCNLVAIKAGGASSPSAAKKYLTALYKVILEQLQINNRVVLWGFGIFEIHEREGGNRLLPDLTDEEKKKKLVYVKPRNVIRFKPSQILDTNINENNFKLKFSMQNKLKEKKKPSKRFFEENITDLLNIAERRSGKQWQNK